MWCSFKGTLLLNKPLIIMITLPIQRKKYANKKLQYHTNKFLTFNKMLRPSVNRAEICKYRLQCRQCILTSQMNSFFLIFAKSVFNYNCIKYKNTWVQNERIHLRSPYTLTTVDCAHRKKPVKTFCIKNPSGIHSAVQ